MTAEVTTLPAPEQIKAVEGEVIEPSKVLAANEKIVRANLKKFEAVQASVARALNIIYRNDLWKLHKTAEGKRRYTNFGDYLATEFGYDKSLARAHQIMKADLPDAIEAGDVPPDSGDKRRTRNAPEVTAEKAAKVTSKQLLAVLDAFNTRLGTVEQGEGYFRLEAILGQAQEMINPVIDALDELVAALAAEAESAEDEATETPETN